MEIPENTLNRWLSLKESGDIDKLAKKLKKTPQTVHKIFRDREGKVEDIILIIKFYEKKQKEINAIKLPS